MSPGGREAAMEMIFELEEMEQFGREQTETMRDEIEKRPFISNFAMQISPFQNANLISLRNRL
jgi:hypothetical protein